MSDKGPSGLWSGTTGDLTDGGMHRIVNGFTTKLNPDKQGKHIPQHRNYQEGKSVFHGSLKDAQELIDEFAGKGEPAGHQRERVDCGKTIGTYVNPETGARLPTSMVIIVYSQRGAHFFPSRPKDLS